MGLLAMGAIAVSGILIGSVVLPVVADHWKEGGDEAGNLVMATGATVRKADDLGDSFGRVVPPHVEASEGNDVGHLTHPGADQSTEPYKHDWYGSNGEHEVGQALQALTALGAGEASFTTDEHINAIRNLRDAWSPRYQQAEEEHRWLSHRIEHADRAARRYFETQSNLTQRINNSEDRLRAAQGDIEEREIYRQWREQAGRTMAQADQIMADLQDMDIRITKQLLSANFASVYQDFQQMPAAISALRRDLEQFRARSEEINAAFGTH